MPCNDGPGYYSPEVRFEPSQETLNKIEWLEAALCMFMRRNADSTLSNKDFKSAGVKPKQLYNWWVEHEKADNARLLAEQEAQRKEYVRQEALAKLTQEEKDVLKLR